MNTAYNFESVEWELTVTYLFHCFNKVYLICYEQEGI